MLTTLISFTGISCKKKSSNNAPPPTDSGGGIVTPPNPQPGNQTHNLKISKAGDGEGTITSTPEGINCGTDCTEDYAEGTSVTLKAAPSVPTTSFVGWEGDCTGVGDCVLTMDKAKEVIEKIIYITRVGLSREIKN